jgi:hypothetical protein
LTQTLQVDLGSLALVEGGYLLVKRALRRVAPGERISVTGQAEGLDVDLRGWCRAEGHRFLWQSAPVPARGQAHIVAGSAESERWAGFSRVAGEAGANDEAVADHPPRSWGLAARGATVEAGAPEFDFQLADKVDVWTDDAARIYQVAAAAQWDPDTAIAWNVPFVLDDDLEDAIVQVMTFLIENETAALIVPSRFIAQLHPHFREVMQVLAVQAADEARHIEVFTRRARLKRIRLGRSTIGGQASLKTLVEEPDFAVASFLLSVLGEGTFLSLLRFIERYAPDPVTAAVAKLAAQDEARHVAFGLAHLTRHLEREPGLRIRLADAVRRRHNALRHVALNDEVFDALLLMAAGSWDHEALRQGSQRVLRLIHDMDEGRRRHLVRLGFPEAEAAELSALHTPNFM